MTEGHKSRSLVDNCGREDNIMGSESFERINRCLDRIADLRARGDAETHLALKAELLRHEALGHR
jgi:hypothetical protein